MAAAGDMVATYGLDDKALQAGLKSVEASAGKSVAKTDGILSQAGNSFRRSLLGVGNIGGAAIGALATAGRLASSGMREFAKVNSDAAAQVAAVEQAWTRMLESVGQGATRLGAGNLLAGLIDGYTKIGQELGDVFIRELGLSEGGAQVDASDAAERRRMQDERFRQARLRSQAAYGAAGGDRLTSGLAQAELNYLRSVEEIQASLLDQDQKAELHAAAILTYEREKAALFKESADAAERAAEARKREADAAERERRQWAERRVDERQSIDDAAESLRIGNLRMRGQDKEADLAEAQLQAERERRQIEESGLSDQEKKARLAELDTLLAERRSLIEAGQDKTRRASAAGLDAGQVTAQSLRQVFGGGTVQDRIATESKKTNEILRAIERKLGGDGAAVYAS